MNESIALQKAVAFGMKLGGEIAVNDNDLGLLKVDFASGAGQGLRGSCFSRGAAGMIRRIRTKLDLLATTGFAEIGRAGGDKGTRELIEGHTS